MNGKQPFQLSLSQFILVIYKTQIGIGVLTLPHDVFMVSGTDGWIAIIVSWILVNVISFLIIKTMEKYPDKNLFEVLPIYFGKWLGKFIILLWILYALYVASVVFYYSIFLTHVWILPNTNHIFLVILFVIPVYMITKRGLPMISRYAQFTFLATLWMIPVMMSTFKQGLWLNLLPVIREGWEPIIQSLPLTIVPYLGFELAFILYPKLKNKKNAFKGTFIANTLSLGVYLTVTILSYIRFSEEEIAQVVWPTLNLLKLIRYPFLERLEIFFISFYLIILFMTIIPFFYMSLKGFNQLFQRSVNKLFLYLILGLWVIGFSIQIPTYTEIIQLRQWWSDLGYGVVVFPIFLWLYSKVFVALKKEPIEQ